ncbi:MAG: ribosome maturation factor RimM [Gammaproteobacteria bacterium]|nr:MAG: ribosome maturation factor RimM [Gammaproteobacteria bacterium]
MGNDLSNMVVMGRISGVYGVRGWIKIFSDTDPRENILNYDPWYLKVDGKWQSFSLQGGKRHGKGVVAHLQGCDERDQALLLLNMEIAVQRQQLPAASENEFYWSDLVGLLVINQQGIELGKIDSLLETGANDVLVVKGDRERLIPFIHDQVVKSVDVEQGQMMVDWDPDF